MKLNKKLMSGALSAMLGISLIGGGTWAAFNDIERVNAEFSAGILDLSVSPTVVFDLDELKPGDYMIREFSITNQGTLDIEKVLMHTDYTVTTREGATVDSELASRYASQFRIVFMTTDLQPIYGPFDNMSLGQLANLTANNQSPDITTYLERVLFFPLKPNLPVNDTDKILMKVYFDNNLAKDGEGLYYQNEFQDLKLDINFDLEGTQYQGVNRSTDES